MTGTEESFASPTTSACFATRATMHDTMDEMTTEVSYSDSLTPNWMSSLPRNIAWPPIAATALSVDTRVRVLRLLNIIATVLPDREDDREARAGVVAPDFRADL